MSKRVKRKKGGFTVLRKAITLGALCLGASTIPYAHALALDDRSVAVTNLLRFGAMIKLLELGPGLSQRTHGKPVGVRTGACLDAFQTCHEAS